MSFGRLAILVGHTKWHSREQSVVEGDIEPVDARFVGLKQGVQDHVDAPLLSFQMDRNSHLGASMARWGHGLNRENVVTAGGTGLQADQDRDRSLDDSILVTLDDVNDLVDDPNRAENLILLLQDAFADQSCLKVRSARIRHGARKGNERHSHHIDRDS